MSAPSDDQPPSGSEGQQHPDSPPPLRESAGSAGERIQVIIEAAEKAAAGIIEDADAQARRYIEASRKRADELADERVRVMSDLTDTLIRQAELVRRQSDELLSALDTARTELATRIGQELTAAQPGQGIGPPASSERPAQAAQGQRVPHLQAVESERPDLQAVKPAADTAAAAEQQPAEQGSAPEEDAPAPPPPSVPPPGSESPGAGPSDGARLLAAQMAVAGSSRQEIETRLREEFGIEDAAPILDGILGPG